MKKCIALLTMMLLLVGCGVTYKTQSGGKDNVSYILVLKASKKSYKRANVVAHIDNKAYVIEKIETVERYQQARPIIVEPGTHNIRVTVDGVDVRNESIYIGVQETRKVLLP